MTRVDELSTSYMYQLPEDGILILSYSTEIPKPTPTPTPTQTGPPVPETPTPTCTPVADNKTYDYIVVGAGAGGITIADKLSQAGKSVLLLERGPPSTGRWGGTMKPTWLTDTNLTRFDVPGLCNQIWHDSTGVACVDTDQMEGCVLGGGTAVNAGLWWKVRSDLLRFLLDSPNTHLRYSQIRRTGIPVGRLVGRALM